MMIGRSFKRVLNPICVMMDKNLAGSILARFFSFCLNNDNSDNSDISGRRNSDVDDVQVSALAPEV
jgi:hypothetical protein